MATNNENLITVTGDVTVDESAGSQNSGTATLTEDNNDNDRPNLTTNPALPTVYLNRLFGATNSGGLGLTQPSATANTFDGQAMAQVLTFAQGAGITDLAFTDLNGAALNGLSSGLYTTTGNYEIFLFTDTNNNIVLGKYDNAPLDPSNALTVAFAIVLDEVKNNNNVLTSANIWVVQFTSLSHTVDGAASIANHDDVVDLTNKLYVKASQELLITNFDDAPANNNAWTAIDPDSSVTNDTQFLVTGLDMLQQTVGSDSYGDTVNTRSTSLGSNSQAIGSQDALRFDTVRGITVPVVNADADFTPRIQYTEHVQSTGLGVTLVQINGVRLNRGDQTRAQVSIFDVIADTATGNDFVAGLETSANGDANNTRVNILSAEVRNSANAVVASRLAADGDGNVMGFDGRIYHFDFGVSSDGDGTATNQVVVSNLIVNQQIIVRAATGETFDRMVVKNVGDGTFDLGGLRILDAFTDIDEVGSRVNFEDDGPTAPALVANANTVTHDESNGLQTSGTVTSTEDNNDNDVDGATLVGGSSIASRFLGSFGSAIGYARSGSALVDITGGGFGADGQGSTSTIYEFAAAAGVASGAQTNDGTQIFVYKEGSILVGRVGNELAAGDTANSAGAVAFALSINDANGEVYVAQYLALKHSNPASHDESSLSKADGTTQIGLNPSAVQVTVTYFDGDGDSATSPAANVGARIRFEDDGPKNFDPEDIISGVKNQPGQSATKDLSGISTLSSLLGINNFTGNDGYGSVVFTGFADGDLLQGIIQDGTPTLENLKGKAPGDTVFSDLRLFGAGTATLFAVAGTSNIVGDRVFSISLDPANDQYTFTMLGQIQNGAQSISVDFSGQKQTIYEWLTLDLPGDDPGDTNNTQDGDFLFTGFAFDAGNNILVRAGTQTQINVSSTGIGVSDQSIDSDGYQIDGKNTTLWNGVFIDFVEGAPRTLDGQAPIGQLTFTGHHVYNNAGFSISQLKPNVGTSTDVRVSIYEETDEANSASPTGLADDAPLGITEITIQARSFDRQSGEWVIDDEKTFTMDTGTSGFTLGTGNKARTIHLDFVDTDVNQAGFEYVDIENLGENWVVLIKTAHVNSGDNNGLVGFERIGVQNVGTGNEGFDISGVFVNQFDSGNRIDMNFDLKLIDGDLDSTIMVDRLEVSLSQPDILL